MNRPTRTPPPARPILATLAGLAVGIAGCRSYEPRPLDLPGHARAFAARAPADAFRALAHDEATPGAAPASPAQPNADAPALPFDLADGVSLAEAEAVATVFNADLRIARLRAGVAAAGADHAGLWADPSIGVDLTRIVQSVAEPWKLAATVGLTLPISGRLSAERDLATADHRAELARVAEQEWTARTHLRRAWHEWSALREQHAVTGRFVRSVDELLSIIDRMEQAGEMSRAEARLFRIERATALADRATLESESRLAHARILRIMGLSPTAAVTLNPTSQSPTQAPSRALTTDPSTPPDELLHANPRLAVARAQHQAAEHALALEIRAQYPDLHVGPGYGREDGDDQVLLSLSMPLPLWNANRRGIAEAEARRALAAAAAETTLEALIADLDAATTRWRAATDRLNLLRVEIDPLIQAQDADARKLAELGEVNALVLLDSLTRRHSIALRLIVAQRDEALAAIDVREILGPDWAGPAAPHAAPDHADTPANVPPDQPSPNLETTP